MESQHNLNEPGNLVVPASKAARSKIARNRNGTANSASANKRSSTRRPAARRGIDLVISDYSTAGGTSRHLFVRVPIAFSSTLLQLPRSYRAIVFSVKSSTQDKIKGGFREAKCQVKEKAGDATGNPNLRDRGTAEKAGGKVQRKIGYLKKVFEQ